MKIRDDYFLAEIKGDTYLLPKGQAIATFSHGVRLEGAGRSLVEAMMTKDGASRDDLVELLFSEYGDSVSRSEIEKDVDLFIESLSEKDIFFRRKGYVVNYAGEEERFYNIAGLRIKYTGPEFLLYPYLDAFGCEGGRADMEICVYDRSSTDYRLGKIIVRSDEILIYDTGYEFGLIYPANTYLKEIIVKKDGSSAAFYVSNMTHEAAKEVFLGMRSAFLVLAQSRGFFAIHSASALYKNGVVLFSGVSGAGKSTHSRLWEEHFGVDLLNGDLNLLGISDRGVTVYGLPWCGTSEIYRPFEEKLHGVFFITQWETNEVRPITGSERVLSLSNRMISPTWTREGCRRNLEFAMKAEPSILLAELKCRVDKEAAEVAKGALDSFLN